jgi:hypothetical protein
MKKAIYYLAPVLIAISIFIACSKDQRVVKQLDGKWKVTAETEDGVAQPVTSYEKQEYSFTACKVKKADCDGSISDPSFTLPFKYNISDKGEKITMTFNLLGTNIVETGTIVEHSDKKFVFSTVDDGKTTVTTLEKI